MIKFFNHLDNDLRETLIRQLRDLWTHSSTAIEGNSLTLGETAFLLNEGLTISGKPLKDHEEVVGHARAIELLYGWVDNKKLTNEDLFLLHRAIQKEVVVDVQHPVGAWKREPNGTYHVDDEGKQRFVHYSDPGDVPRLMERWLAMFNELAKPDDLTSEKALDAYCRSHISFVRVHPFADGNGRMARLLANLPVLRSGFPPILIAKEARYDYIKLLSQYELSMGELMADDAIDPALETRVGYADFTDFVAKQWKQSLRLVENANQEQKRRRERSQSHEES